MWCLDIFDILVHNHE